MSATGPRPVQPAARRRWPRIMLIALLVALMPFVLVATTIAATGTVTVRIHERSTHGMHLVVPVPALLVDLAALLVPRFIPDDALDDLRREAAPYRKGLASMVEAIEDCPSGTLVRVQTAGERVLVSKVRSRFRVAVDLQDLEVRVSAPARLARRALQMVGLI